MVSAFFLSSQLISLLWLRSMQIIRGMSPLRISNRWTSRHGLDLAVNHLHWDGHPLLLKCLENSHVFAGAFTLPWTCPSNSSQMRLVARLGWNLGKELGKSLDVAGEELWCSLLHGVWWCPVETLCQGQPEVGWHVAAGFLQHITDTVHSGRLFVDMQY